MFKDLIRKSIEVYVDDMLVKSKAIGNHIERLNQMFNILWKYQIKLNSPEVCLQGRVRKISGLYGKSTRDRIKPREEQCILRDEFPQEAQRGHESRWQSGRIKSFYVASNRLMRTLFWRAKGVQEIWGDEEMRASTPGPQRAFRTPAALIKANRMGKALPIPRCFWGGSQRRLSQKGRESTIDSLLREQEAPRRRDQKSLAGKTSSGSHGRI